LLGTRRGLPRTPGDRFDGILVQGKQIERAKALLKPRGARSWSGEVESIFVREALLQEATGGKVRCHACERRCTIVPGGFGWCRTRRNRDGRLVTLIYGLISSVASNPIEKKPFYHFYPGTKALTAGSWSCNFGCPWCQNCDISKVAPKKKELQSQLIDPEKLVKMAKENNCRGTSMSFSEPTTFLEYAVDVFELARQNGLANTVVTNGYFTPEAGDLLREKGADAFNIDIKGDLKTYEKYCRADPEKVWANIKRIKEKGVHAELTTLVIPGVNDSNGCLREIAERIGNEAGLDTPWHLSRYFPAYKFEVSPTPITSLETAYEIGKEAGLLYVYLGNVSDHKYENTYCPACGDNLIKRTIFTIHWNKVTKDKKCPSCGQDIPIVVSS